MAEEKKLENLKDMEEAKKAADESEMSEDELDEICGGADRVRGSKINKNNFK